MKATYLGHQEMKSKKGQEMKIVFYSCSNPRGFGLKCDKAFLNAGSDMEKAFPWTSISPGEAIELEFDSSGYLIGLDTAMPIK